MKNFLLIILLLIGFQVKGQTDEKAIANPGTYLKELKSELQVEWPQNRTINIVFHGHSVTAGYFKTPTVNTISAYPNLLLKKLKSIYPYAVVNVIVTAIGGENSISGAERFEDDVLIHKPDVLFIDYGLNDRGPGLEKAYSAWNEMIGKAKEQNIKVILLTPSPDQRVDYKDPNNKLKKHTDQIIRLAKENAIGLVDSYKAFGFAYLDGEELQKYMSQVNHPNEKGHELIANEIIKWFDTLAPLQLVVNEGFENPLGFYDSKPTFSWKLPPGVAVKSQSAYRIVVASAPELLPDRADLWDSGDVSSDQSVWIPYGGTPLISRQKVYWQVMCFDQNGNASAWSNHASFELGLLSNDDWQAKWISILGEKIRDTSRRGNPILRPQYLRREFVLDKSIERASLYITTLGVFEAQINGQKVGDDVMTPGWTPYKKRLETLSYDVKELLEAGENAIGIILGEGWYSGRINVDRNRKITKPLPKALCQLEIEYKNGSKEYICTDSEWHGTANGPIRFSGIYDGEIYDANLEIPGWSEVGFSTDHWFPVKTRDIDPGIKLVPKRHKAVKEKARLTTIELTEPEPGRFVFDLGQNMVGIPELKIPVVKDQKVTIRFAEMLEQDGKMYTDNYRNAISTDYYTARADGEITWSPKFTFHGFRYVELSGFDANAEPQKSWVTGIVQYSDFEQTGHFSSSHEKLNKLQSNINWGLKGNFFDIPTDCPQRDERLGWTGDAQVFAPTSIFNADVHAFWASWLQSVREEQAEDGSVPFVVPNVLGKNFSSGWADAATVIPWEIYFRTGVIEVLEENFEMMKRLVGYYQSKAKNHIADVNSFGDWLQPYAKMNRHGGDTPKNLIGTAYYARSVDLTMKAARVLGYSNEVSELRALRDSIRIAFAEKFIDKKGKLRTKNETQTGYLMALAFDLVPEKMADMVILHLIRKIEEADNHLRTGFLGTPLLATVLDKYGYNDLMYSILFKETYPSWFYSINQGATTMWERWNSYSHDNGFGNASMNSFNHYAYGAIGQWMYERIAGISPLEAGYKRILIAPKPGDKLEFAEAEYDSMYGKIKSGWKKTNGGLELNVTIPPNTSAQIVIPIDEGMKLMLDGKLIDSQSVVVIETQSKSRIVLNAGPGSYLLKTML